jgi:Tol biopolymer transport system component
LTHDATDYMTISLDEAGHKMIATQVSNSFRLHVASMGDFKNARILNAARGCSFAPDGRIIYSSDDGDIWTINPDGSEKRQLTNNSFADFSPQGSPDAQYIFFASNRTGSNQIWRMNADGSNQVQLTQREGGYPRFVSRDGKWVYFESGLHQTLWRVSSDGHEETQVSSASVYAPAFSPDGKLIAYFFWSGETNKRLGIAVMTIDGSRIVKTFDLAREKLNAFKLAWETDNQSLNYISVDGVRNSLWRQSLVEAVRA